MKRRSRPGRFAERTLDGVDDTGAQERVVFWIERRTGALWVVGRTVNPQFRTTDEPRPDDVVFEGYELEEALVQANEALDGKPDDAWATLQRALELEPQVREWAKGDDDLASLRERL